MKMKLIVYVILMLIAAFAFAACGGGSDGGVVPTGLNLPTELTLISNTADAPVADGHSFQPSISADGRYVAFGSAATNLVAGDTNGFGDTFVRDMLTGNITLISNTANAPVADANSGIPSISSHGRYVAFQSGDTNLVDGDTNGFSDTFVRDTQTGDMTLISNSATAPAANGNSGTPSISSDGRYVVYISGATNLVAGDTGFVDVFVRDMLTGDTLLISNTSDAPVANGHSSNSLISGDGKYVVFQSGATNLVTGDTNGFIDVFVRDMLTGGITLISNSASSPAADGDSYIPTISSDGRYVAFWSTATNLVEGDTNGFVDVFLRDMQTGDMTIISNSTIAPAADGGSSFPSISTDGRYAAFSSNATNLVAGDTNGFSDVFVRDMQTGDITLISNSATTPASDGDSFNSLISADGKYVVFSSDATNLVTGDTNGARDIFFTPVNW